MKRLQIPQKLVHEKFYGHENIFTHTKLPPYILLTEKRKENM